MLHGGEFFGAGPGDCQEKDRVGFGFYVVTDGGAEGEESAGAEVVRLAIDGDAELALEDMDGDGAVGVVLLHVSGVLHGDEDDPQVVLLEEGFGVNAGGPGLLLLGLGNLLGQIELRHFVDHGAILQGGCHVAPFRADKFALPGG